MIYYPFFIAYLAIGFYLTVVAFYWALRSGQFKDQQRARYLPLDDTEYRGWKVTKFNRYEGYVLIAVICLGLLTSMAGLFFAMTAPR